MADLTKTTTLVNGDVFDPEVVTDIINAKVEKKAVMTGYIKVDNTLEGVPGSTKTVPKWGYIGDTEEYAEVHHVAEVIIDTLSMEAMVPVRVSYGTIVNELKEVSRS